MTTEEEKQQAKQILIGAKQIIEAGWVQGVGRWTNPETGQECHCLIAAIESAAISVAGLEGRLDAYGRVSGYVRREIKRLDIYGGYITRYNDDLRRTKEDVVKLLEDSIASI